MLGAETRLVALLGDPVAHSRSPLMQNAAFAARGLDWAYVACRVDAAEFDDAVRGLAALGFAGANVTIPHKAAAARVSDVLDDAAERGGSVNTLVFRDGRIEGSSTDGEAVVGAVDAGRARACSCSARAARRRRSRRRCATRAPPRCASRRGATTTGRRTAPDATLLVNATPLVDEVPVAPRAGQAVVDLAYRADASPTALVEAARAAGATRSSTASRCSSARAPPSFERWTGVPAPLDVMRAAVRAVALAP